MLLEEPIVRAGASAAKPGDVSVAECGWRCGERDALRVDVRAMRADGREWAPRNPNDGDEVDMAADKAPRVDAARAARAAQACGVGLSCLALPHLADETSWLPLLLAGSAIEALGAVVTKGAPRKDWAPTLLDGDALRKATVSLSNAALLGELAGPALGAFILGASRAPTVGAAAVAGELAAQAALERLRARAPHALSAPKGETTKVAPAWAAFFGQPSGAAITTVAFALLWFTALTPHAPVLLAALADRGAPAESLAAFRAAGALAGPDKRDVGRRSSSRTCSCP